MCVASAKADQRRNTINDQQSVKANLKRKVLRCRLNCSVLN